MEYFLIQMPSVEELQDAVTESMQDGWFPVGGVATFIRPDKTGTRLWYLQAVVRNDKED